MTGTVLNCSWCSSSGFSLKQMCRDPFVIPMSPGSGRKEVALLVTMLLKSWGSILGISFFVFSHVWSHPWNRSKINFYYHLPHASQQKTWLHLKVLSNVMEPHISFSSVLQKEESVWFDWNCFSWWMKRIDFPLFLVLCLLGFTLNWKKIWVGKKILPGYDNTCHTGANTLSQVTTHVTREKWMVHKAIYI